MLPRGEDLPNSAQGLPEYRLDGGQRKVPPGRPRHDDEVARNGQRMAIEAVSLAKQPLDAVPADRVPMPFADAQSQPRVAQSVRQGADANLAKLKGAPFLKNAVEFPFEPHMLERSKPAVHFHSNVLHRAAEPLGRPEHYNISSIACCGQAVPEGGRRKPDAPSGGVAVGSPHMPICRERSRRMYLSATTVASRSIADRRVRAGTGFAVANEDSACESCSHRLTVSAPEIWDDWCRSVEARRGDMAAILQRHASRVRMGTGAHMTLARRRGHQDGTGDSAG